MNEIDLASVPVRALNERLHRLPADSNDRLWRVVNPRGAHAIAAGLTVPVQVEIDGHVGYYCAGMNEQATVIVRGHAGTGLAENIMSGVVRVTGNASQSAAASGRGARLVTLGHRTLRADAVPVAVISILQFLWDAG